MHVAHDPSTRRAEHPNGRPPLLGARARPRAAVLDERDDPAPAVGERRAGPEGDEALCAGAAEERDRGAGRLVRRGGGRGGGRRREERVSEREVREDVGHEGVRRGLEALQRGRERLDLRDSRSRRVSWEKQTDEAERGRESTHLGDRERLPELPRRHGRHLDAQARHEPRLGSILRLSGPSLDLELRHLALHFDEPLLGAPLLALAARAQPLGLAHHRLLPHRRAHVAALGLLRDELGRRQDRLGREELGLRRLARRRVAVVRNEAQRGVGVVVALQVGSGAKSELAREGGRRGPESDAPGFARRPRAY